MRTSLEQQHAESSAREDALQIDLAAAQVISLLSYPIFIIMSHKLAIDMCVFRLRIGFSEFDACVYVLCVYFLCLDALPWYRSLSFHHFVSFPHALNHIV